MNRITPVTRKSAVVTAYESCSRYAFWAKFVGWSCMPCCCAGLPCLIVGDIPRTFAVKFGMLIELYGGEKKMHMLADKIAEEQSLFRDAVTFVTDTIDATKIKANITLWNVICAMHPKINSLTASLSFDSHFEDNTYAQQIWDRYVSTGGNYSVIVYGLIEYMCSIYDPTCIIVDECMSKVLSDSSLRVEVLSHKTAAGF